MNRNRSNKDEGDLGEKLAVDYLEKQGFQILERNFHIRGGEVDIIAIDPSDTSGQATLAFIEVKTRRSWEFGTPLEAITPWKLRALIKTAQFYKQTHRNLPELMRIDAVAIVLGRDNEIISLELVKNIS